MKEIQPADVAQPASNYALAVHLPAGGERLIIAGQVGNRADGTTADGFDAQMEQTYANVFAILREAGFAKTDLVRCVVYVTEPGRVAAYRDIRDRMLDGHRCPHTYIQVSGLAAPEWLCEVEAEAHKPA